MKKLSMVWIFCGLLGACSEDSANPASGGGKNDDVDYLPVPSYQLVSEMLENASFPISDEEAEDLARGRTQVLPGLSAPIVIGVTTLDEVRRDVIEGPAQGELYVELQQGQDTILYIPTQSGQEHDRFSTAVQFDENDLARETTLRLEDHENYVLSQFANDAASYVTVRPIKVVEGATYFRHILTSKASSETASYEWTVYKNFDEITLLTGFGPGPNGHFWQVDYDGDSNTLSYTLTWEGTR